MKYKFMKLQLACNGENEVAELLPLEKKGKSRVRHLRKARINPEGREVRGSRLTNDTQIHWDETSLIF